MAEEGGGRLTKGHDQDELDVDLDDGFERSVMDQAIEVITKTGAQFREAATWAAAVADLCERIAAVMKVAFDRDEPGAVTRVSDIGSGAIDLLRRYDADAIDLDEALRLISLRRAEVEELALTLGL